MTKIDALELLKLNQTLYKLRPDALTDAELNKNVEIWAWQFKDYDAAAVKRAFLMAVRVCKYPVTIADVFEQLNAMQPTASPEGMWQELKAACKKAQKYLPWRSCPMIIGIDGNGEKIRSNGQKELQELFDGLPDATKSYLGSTSALVDLANNGADDYRRSEFVRYVSNQPASIGTAAAIGGWRSVARLEGKK